MNNSEKYTVAGKNYSFSLSYGEVLEATLLSETHVRGGGGGGSINTAGGNVQGYISPISINSDVINKSRIWVKNNQGIEEEWKFPAEISYTPNASNQLAVMAVVNKAPNAR